MSKAFSGLLEINFGGIAAPIADQLKRQKIKVEKLVVDAWQNQANAIKTLYFNKLLTDAESSKAKKRLFKAICKHLEQGGKQ